jgi:hypothetical protein
MLDPTIYVGSYYLMGFLINIQESNGILEAAIAGVPAGYEIQLEHIAGDQFQMQGGPVDGSTCGFTRDGNGAVTELKIGQFFELSKVSTEKVALLPVTRRLTTPAVSYHPEKEAAFQSLLDTIQADPNGAPVDYQLPYPKHEFVQFVMAQDTFIFHGSNNRAITEFTPVRTSAELFDRHGRGNLAAVYGTHDGLWAMFFAVVDREKLRGSIRNGVMYVHNSAGEQLAVYNFSINQEQLPEKPWTAGALYLLPRGSFERQMLTENSYSNEWASYTPVKPLVRLDVEPEDFPFLDQIEGHDDSISLQSENLGKMVRAAARTASIQGDRFTITVPNLPELAEAISKLIEIQVVMIPTAQFSVKDTAGELELTIENLPPAYQQIYRKNYQELLDT